MITSTGLRADAVGALDGRFAATPHIDRFAAEAEVVLRAIASSSATIPSLASLLTGLRPWQHQVLLDDDRPLDEEIPTLAATLSNLGYRTTAYLDAALAQRDQGLRRGFDEVRPLRGGGRALADLRSISKESAFLWIHIEEPQPPYRQPPASGSGPPQRVELFELEPYRNPGKALPEPRRQRFLRSYLQHVRRLDLQVGQILDALRDSGGWDQSLVVVTAVHGEEFGEHGQIGHGNHLGRVVIEVPLLIKLPKSQHGRLAGLEAHVATNRLWATVVEASGGVAPPAVAPSLFRTGTEGAVSELYCTNGENFFSLVRGDQQLVRRVRFAPPERFYYLARRFLVREPRLEEPPELPDALFARLTRAFERSRPFTGGVARTSSWRWTDEGIERQPADEALERTLTEALGRLWGSFVDEERTPEEEARTRRSE